MHSNISLQQTIMSLFVSSACSSRLGLRLNFGKTRQILFIRFVARIYDFMPLKVIDNNSNRIHRVEKNKNKLKIN